MSTAARIAAAFAIASLFAIDVAAQRPNAWPLPTVELPPEMAIVLRDYEKAWKAGDGARLAQVFTADGFVLPSGQLPRRGTAEIARWHTTPGGDLELVAFAFAAADTVGYIVGGYRYPTTKGPGGKFLLALRREAGRAWRIAADIENHSQ